MCPVHTLKIYCIYVHTVHIKKDFPDIDLSSNQIFPLKMGRSDCILNCILNYIYIYAIHFIQVHNLLSLTFSCILDLIT